MADDLTAALSPLLDRASIRGRRTPVSAMVPVAWRDPALFAAARAIDDEAAIWLRRRRQWAELWPSRYVPT